MKKATLLYTLLTLLVIAMGAYWGYELFMQPAKKTFLVGETSSAHHQIEMACDACHQEPFGGGEVLQNACMGCHEKELKDAHDSHPKSKFTDPRNADRLEKIDARSCVACHREHKPEITRDMGVTLAADFCVACHESIEEDRPSHKGMGFETCASAGCHNFHDNRALYEDFLVHHAEEPSVNANPVIAAVSDYIQKPAANYESLEPDYSERSYPINNIIKQWKGSAHATPESNCSVCHSGKVNNALEHDFVETPDALVCVGCHQNQSAGFLSGKHGMRLSINKKPEQSYPINRSLTAHAKAERLLSPMTPGQGRLAFKTESFDHELTCNTCHGAHDYRLDTASIDACIGCHDDQHTNAYKASSHYALVLKERAGELPLGSAVTCATCHMPKTQDENDEALFYTEHNQNYNFKPNEKMIRSVCMNCHSVQFSIDALADPTLIENNFNGLPTTSINSIQMSIERVRE